MKLWIQISRGTQPYELRNMSASHYEKYPLANGCQDIFSQLIIKE